MWKHPIFRLTLWAIAFFFAFSFIKPDIANANSYHWGFSKSKDGKPADAGQNLKAC